MKRTMKIMSLVLSVLMIVSAMTISLGAKEDEDVKYQVARKIATVDQNLTAFSVSKYGFAIGNTIYDPDGEVILDIPESDENGKDYELVSVNGTFGEMFWWVIEGYELIEFGQFLIDIYTGEVICECFYENIEYPEDNVAVVDGDIYVGTELKESLPCEMLQYIGGGMYLCLYEEDLMSDTGMDLSIPHVVYDIAADSCTTFEAGVIPTAFEYGYENGVFVRSDEKYYIGNRNGEPVNDVVYEGIAPIGAIAELLGLPGNGCYIASEIDASGESGEVLVLTNSGELVASFEINENSMEVPVIVTDKWIVTIDFGAIFGEGVPAYVGVYTSKADLVGRYEDLALFGDNAFVAMNSEGYAIFYSNGSITEGTATRVLPVSDGKYVIVEEADGARRVFSAENAVIGDYICDFVGDYEYLGVSLVANDVVLATKGGKEGVLSYDGRELVPFADGLISVTEFVNGNILVSVDYMGEDADEWYTDIYLITYESTPFSDVADGEWYTEYIKYAYENGLVKGMPDGTFAPDDEMTRAELVTVLWRAAGQPIYVSDFRFDDVPEDAWYYNSVMWAAGNDIVLGDGNGNFDPDENITREQLAAILYRFMAEDSGELGENGAASSFVDSGDISDWAVESIEWAVTSGLIKGEPATGGFAVKPQDNATRAEVATILKRAFAD